MTFSPLLFILKINKSQIQIFSVMDYLLRNTDSMIIGFFFFIGQLFEFIADVLSFIPQLFYSIGTFFYTLSGVNNGNNGEDDGQ